MKFYNTLPNLYLELMNYKLKKFWNSDSPSPVSSPLLMNYKLKKFWNILTGVILFFDIIMNYKLKKFWNSDIFSLPKSSIKNEL